MPHPHPTVQQLCVVPVGVADVGGERIACLCGRRAVAGGRCKMHDMRYRRTGDPTRVRVARPPTPTSAFGISEQTACALWAYLAAHPHATWAEVRGELPWNAGTLSKALAFLARAGVVERARTRQQAAVVRVAPYDPAQAPWRAPQEDHDARG